MQLDSRRLAVVAAAAVVASAAAVAAGAVHATALVPAAGSYTVNAAFDAPDANPGDGICLSTVGPNSEQPACTLRAAVMEANSDAPGSVITITAGVSPVLTIAPGSDDQATGDLLITKAMTINGQGSGSTTVSTASSPLDRLFHVASGTSGTTAIGKMTIQSGDPTADSSGSTSGGGIDEDDALQNGRPTLHLSDVVIKSSKGAGGGGLHDLGGNLTADHLTLSADTATTNKGGGGGLIELTGGETVSLTSIQVRGNSGVASGAGLAITGTGSGSTVGVDGAVVDSNTTNNEGGGLEVSTTGGGTFTFTHMTLTANTAFNGGGIYTDIAAGTATFSDSQIGDLSSGCDTGNVARQTEGGGDGAGVYDASASSGVLYTRLLISDNCADDRGGGIYLSGSNASISNSTITGNSAGAGGGGIALGRSSASTITFATVSNNISDGGPASGGGIDVGQGDTASVGASVFDANVQFTPQQARGQFRPRQAGTPDLCQNDGTLNDLGYNVLHGGGLNNCTFTSTGDTTGDPRLQPLADNGGPTRTQALVTGSAALDTVPAGLTPGFRPRATATCNVATDQRGVSRPQGSGCDSGAYELRVAPPPASPTPTSSTTASPTASAQPLIGPPNTGAGPVAPAGIPVVAALALATGLAALVFAARRRLRRIPVRLRPG